jgi:uroporphyrinogen decarboxylase
MASVTDPDCIFLKACRRQPTSRTPIWLMRQAGRYQREYRELRQRVSMLELCRTPELASQVTLRAVEQLGVDAAIIFADILLITETLGLQLEFSKGEGPVIGNPVRQADDLERLTRPDVSALDYVYEAIRLTRAQLPPEVALIGFCGAPFTVSSYIIEGGKSRNYVHTKTMMHCDDATWRGLMERLVAMSVDYLNAQIDAGADAVQVFDSWAGILCPDDYRRFVLPYVQALIAGVADATPVIYFAQGNPALLPLIKQTGADVIGVDWRVDLADAWSVLGDDVAIMGNLDPVTLLTSPAKIRAAADAILTKAAGRPGHIFNLGHGVLPQTDPNNAIALVEAVHEISARKLG